jgi:cell division protein FtsL
MRILIVSSTFLAIASAFLLYGLNYDTRRVEAEMHRLDRAADGARSDIAVLKAERAHLARPDRIEPIARAQGLAPVSGKQLVQTGDESIVRAR